MPLSRRQGLALLAVVALSLVVRFLPLVPFAIWGSDSGEYLLLTERLVTTGRVSFEYTGWGVAYPYFPGHFVVDGAARLVLGLDAIDAFRVTLPAIASVLLPLGVFLLARRLVGDLRVALLSAAFVAVVSVNAIVTSHPMPGTLGHVILLVGLVALAHAYDERAWLLWACLAAVALVPTHHLSTWFFAGSVAAVLLVREAARASWDRERLVVEASVLAAVVLPAGVWWLGVADAFRDGILTESGLPPALVAAAGYAALAAGLPLLVVLRRRLLSGWRPRLRWPSPTSKAAMVGAVVVVLVAMLVALLATRVPGGNLRITPLTVAYSMPVVVWLAFAPVGMRLLRFHRHGSVVLGWTLAILASLAIAVGTGSRVLFPFRHPDYLMVALALPVGLGMLATYDDLRAWRSEERARATRRAAGAALALLLVVSLLLSQPPRETVGGFEEGVTPNEWRMVQWSAENLPPGATVAADHRLSSLLFGVAGARPTWDSAYDVFHSEDWEEARGALACADIVVEPCARIEYVAVSRVVDEGVILVQWENARPMSLAAREKFFDPERFQLVYADPSPDDWVFLFRVRWDAGDPAPEGAA